MDSSRFTGIVDGLAASYRDGFGINNTVQGGVPDRESVSQLCSLLLHVVFPGFFANNQAVGGHKPSIRRLIADLEDDLQKQLHRAFGFYNSCRGEAGIGADAIIDISAGFLEQLPKVRALLATDVEAAYDNDPAAATTQEIIVSYPCIEAIAVQRMAHELYRLNVPFLPRMMTEIAHSHTGIDMHPGATIGEYFFIDHGTGVVIGETTTIGSHVVLYHGVTLGAFNPTIRNEDGELERGQDNKRHPDLEDHVTVYPGATILGGGTRIGHHSIIGGNAWITRSVSPWSTVTMADPELRIRQKQQQAAGSSQPSFDI